VLVAPARLDKDVSSSHHQQPFEGRGQGLGSGPEGALAVPCPPTPHSGVRIAGYGLTVSVSSCVAKVLYGCALACRHLTMIV
jgi:hypothetical protein